MAKKTADRAAPAPATNEEPEAQPASEVAAQPSPAAHAAAEPSSSAPAQPAKEPVYAADPRSMLSVSLSNHQGGPAMHLLRSHKFNQMQVLFEGEQPDERHLAILKESGWRNRTQEEGVWTKQIDRDAKWQSVDRMEREFKAVANAIRKEKGMESALEGLAVA
jgi:hypothetical protein